MGVNTPFCDGIVDIVRRVERGEMPYEESNIDPLAGDGVGARPCNFTL